MAARYDVFVIGAGVAGLTAAAEAARRGLSVALAEEAMFGGLIMNVNHLQPGLDGAVPWGSELAADLMEQATDAGAASLFEKVTGLERADDGLAVETAGGEHLARAVVLASGARLRQLGLPGEAEFEQRGVSHCADCDGPLYRGQPVTVVGGGDSALQEALVLAQFCSQVRLVHRGTDFTARPDFVEAVLSNPRIAVNMRTTVEMLRGGAALSSVVLDDLASGERYEVPCAGFFAYVGLEPNIGCLPPSVELAGDHVRVDDRLETSLPGVFAVGAVRAGCGGTIADAAADARRAVAVIAEHLG